MATATQTLPAPSLYEQDFHLWLEGQKKAVAARDTSAIDWDNLAEEIDGLGLSEKRELRNRLKRLYHHLLKWHLQPGRRSHSWQTTIGEQRSEIAELLNDSPSLRRFLVETQPRAYALGCTEFVNETGIARSMLPVDVPWPLEAVLDSAFMPDPPWKPEELLRD